MKLRTDTRTIVTAHTQRGQKRASGTVSYSANNILYHASTCQRAKEGKGEASLKGKKGKEGGEKRGASRDMGLRKLGRGSKVGHGVPGRELQTND